MTTLYQKLTDTFLKNPNYNYYSSVDELYPILRKFLLDSIRQGDSYINPMDFSYDYAINPNFSKDVFLELSKDINFLYKYYNVYCEECGEYTITNDLYDVIQCVHCQYEVEDMYEESKKKLEKLQYLFRISPSLTQELKNNLKVLPSSFVIKKEEGKKEENIFNPEIALHNLKEEEELLMAALQKVALENQ